MTDIPRYNAPRGTTLCEAAGGELVMAADHDLQVSALRAALHSCAKASSAAEVGLIVDEALAASRAQQALAPENQRAVPAEPLLASRHPFDRPSVLKDCDVEYLAGAQLPSIRLQREKLLADVEAGIADQLVRDRLVALGWTPPGGASRLVHVPALDEHLRFILGRPNFWCYHLANALRAMGQEIARKAEEEQAAVIHFLLNAYFEHGPGWREAVEQILAAEREKELAKGVQQ